MQEISAVCDEIIIINEGKMITKDTPENITKKMVDTNGVHVVVNGDKTKLKDALRTISGIKNVSYDRQRYRGGIRQVLLFTVQRTRI